MKAPFGKRYGHSTVIFNGQIYLIGGRDDQTLFNDIWVSENGHIWTKVLPEDEEQYWVFTKQTSITGISVNNLIHNPDKENQNPFPWFSPRQSHCSVSHNGYLYVIGGYEDLNTTRQVKDVWKTVDESSGARKWLKIGNDIPFSKDSIKGLECFTNQGSLQVMNKIGKQYYFSNGLQTLDILKLKPKSSFPRSNSYDKITLVDSSINWVPISSNFVVPFNITVSSIAYNNNPNNYSSIDHKVHMMISMSREQTNEIINYYYQFKDKPKQFNTVYNSSDIKDWKLVNYDAPYGDRHGFTSVYQKCNLYIIGGLDRHGFMFNDTWELYQNHSWQKVKHKHNPLIKINTTVVQMYAQAYPNTTYQSNFKNQIADKFWIRTGHTSTVVDNKILNIGGYLSISHIQYKGKKYLGDVCAANSVEHDENQIDDKIELRRRQTSDWIQNNV